MGISERIKSIRENKRIKQVELANSLNLAPSYYSRLEKRGEKMTIEQIQSIADALDVSLGEILGFENKPISIDTEQIKQLQKRVGELEELSGLFRKQNEKLMNSIEIAADVFIPEMHYSMIDKALERGFLNEDNTTGYLTWVKYEEDGAVNYDISNEYNLHTDFFLFDILSVEQLTVMVRDLYTAPFYFIDLLYNADAIMHEKLKQAVKEVHNDYYKRYSEVFVPPNRSDYLFLRNKQ